MVVVIPPKIILVRPQLQENVGATARAMKNFMFSDLCLVDPREALEEKAYAMSSGATDILDNTVISSDLNSVISDTHFVLATTARHRDIHKPVYLLQDSIKLLLERQHAGQKCAILFGPERTGLENDDITLVDALVRIPVNPEFASLNLAQSVLLCAYEYFKQSSTDLSEIGNIQKPATKQDINYMIQHLIDELDQRNFFYPEEKRPSLISVISHIFTRNNLSEQEVRTLRGVIRQLSEK